MDRYAVFGNPVAHSKSPLIHRMFAEQTGQRLGYERIEAPLDGFPAAVSAFRAAGGRGANVTVPFKEEAWRLAERRSPRAERARAVNTFVFEGELYGDNTDGVGLVRDLTANHGEAVAGRRLLLLGAGGAARGVLPALVAEAPAELVLANRTPERAEAVAGEFADLFPLTTSSFADLAGRRFDLVVNATAAGLQGDLPPLPDDLLAAGAACYDLVYADRPTAFVRWAREHGAALAADGLGMLVEQAAESFRLWRGIRPDTAPVIAALRPA